MWAETAFFPRKFTQKIAVWFSWTEGLAARMKELQEAATSEKERKKNMPLQPLDYPIPFVELQIFPNRITQRPKTAQILYDEEGASFGDRFKETVYLYEENGRTVLVCEKQRRDEHSPQSDSEWSMNAKLSLIPQPVHYIPLIKWALSMPWWANLRQFADTICVTCPSCKPLEYSFYRYQRIKSSSRKNSHDQLGWNCTYDEIALSFDRPDIWHLCRDSHWQEAPSGLPYQVSIQMRLRPGMEKESDETLCGLLDNLPWWNPDSADKLMWNARNWLDEDWLNRQAEFNDSMHKKNPHNDNYKNAADEILHQLCLLNEKSTVKEDPK